VSSNTFCVLPWIHAATLPDGTVQLCCVASEGSGVNVNHQTLTDFWQSAYLRDVRKRMLDGEPVSACRNCYREERSGSRSHRIVENRVWRERLGEAAIDELVASTGLDGALTAPLQYVDLRLGNTCNLQCVMCQPRESSRWLPASKQMVVVCKDDDLASQLTAGAALDQTRFEWSRGEAFWKDLKQLLPGVKEIILAGGEPFLVKEQFAFVRACCELGEARHIRLRYHTNATVFPEGMAPYWAQFERVHFLVSIDGVGDVAAYVRYPSDWREVDANVRQFDAVGGNSFTSFLFTAHALSLLELPKVLEWVERSAFRSRRWFPHLQDYVSIGLVHNPPHQHVSVLPLEAKRLIKQRISSYLAERLAGQRTDKIEAVVTAMEESDNSRYLPRLRELVRLLDATRGTSFTQTFPDLASFLSTARQAAKGSTAIA